MHHKWIVLNGDIIKLKPNASTDLYRAIWRLIQKWEGSKIV